MADYTLKNLKDDVEDSAVQFGLSPALEARFAREPLELQNSGASYLRLSPGERVPWGHTHKQQEEVYVVVGGSGRIKLDVEAGPEGIELILFGAPNAGPRDAELAQGWWTD